MFLRQGVQSISDLIKLPGIVNLDFADITSVMKDAGYAHMGVGHATGKDKASQAAKIGNFQPTAGDLHQRRTRRHYQHYFFSRYWFGRSNRQLPEMIAEMVHPDANIIWGTAFDENMEDEMSVTVNSNWFPGY